MNEIVNLPIPLSKNRMVFIKYPPDLSSEDVERIICVLKTIPSCYELSDSKKDGRDE